MKTLVQLSIFITILYTVIQAPNFAPKQIEATVAKNTPIVEVKAVEPPVEPVTEPEPTPQEYAHQKIVERWDEDNWVAFNKLVHKESGWRTDAENKSSGAYGIPQCLPVSKCIAEYPDFKTNPISQINWMLDYVDQRYGSPINALNFHISHNWY